MKIRDFGAFAAAICLAQAAYADGPYYGIGLAAYQSESATTAGSGSPSEDTYAAIGGTVGYRWDQSGNFYGVEADLDIALDTDFENQGGTACSVTATGPYYCEHNGTLRLRGVFGADLGSLEGFGSLGFAIMQGEGAISSSATDRGVNTGYTVGLGLQQPLTTGMMRYELVYDNLEETTTKPGGVGEPDFESLSLKVSYIFY